MKNNNQYEVIIVGGSYAGLAAAMALGRALRKVLVIDSGFPCNRQTPYSHNFLTNDGKTPAEISSIARQQVSRYNSVTFLPATVMAAQKTEAGFNLHTTSGEIFETAKLVFATGIKDIMPAIPGFAECWGISILHCPYCHGYEVRHQKTGILANGDTAIELSSLIQNWTNDITLFTNGESALTKEQTAKLQQHAIGINEKEIIRIDQKAGIIKSVIFKDGTDAGINALYTRLPFVQHCDVPMSLGCELTPDGYIKTDAAQRTSVKGVYACGDNTTKMRTVANAVAMGTTTGLMVNKEMIEESF